MMVKKILFVLLAGFYCSDAALGQTDTLISYMLASERENLPVPGEALYDLENMAGYNFNTANGATRVIMDADSSLEFGKLFRISVKRAGNNAWEPQFQTPANVLPVNKGDVLFYVFYIHTTDTDSPNDFGKADFFIQRNSSPWTGLGSISMSLSTTWRKIYVIGEAGEDYEAGQMGATFHLGFQQQDVEIGGVLALNLGPDVDKDLLPGNEVVYEGMEADASWREAAAQRIEEHRKSNISLKVSDAGGNSLEAAAVSLEMKRHAFGFGNFIADNVLYDDSDGLNYQEYQLEMFNVATTPFYMGGNSDNWGWYGNDNNQTIYPAKAQWLKNHRVPAKGHVLVWPSWNWMPSFFEDLKDDPDGLHDAIDTHLETLVPIGKEKGLYEWDVVNEPFINHDVMDILGEEILVEWYKRVHEMDPDPKLILNEYNILMGGGRFDFRENFERLISYLQEEEAPLHGIGMQCHFDENLAGIPFVLETYDHYQEFGLPIQITEFDVAIRDEEIQADYLRDFYTATFSHPAVEKIVMWGFWEKVMWKPLGALVRNDWSHKPNYDVYMDLLYQQWWTPPVSGQTDASGGFELRAFDGYYDISVEIGDSVYLMKDVLIEKDTLLQLDPGAFPDYTSISHRSQDDQFTAFPNPCDDMLWIEYQVKEAGEFAIRLQSLDGRVVKEERLQHPSSGNKRHFINLQNLDPGLYLCSISGSRGARFSPLKVIKK